MKKQLTLGTLFIMILLLLSSCAAKEMIREEDMPGGIRDWSRDDAPKLIKSKVIDHFECEFKTNLRTEEGYDYFVMEMIREKEQAACRLQAYSDWALPMDLVFDAPLSALDDLQKLADQYDLARYNGQDRQVNGLPPNLGARLRVVYASGERIYASDNSTSVLDYRAENAIQAFFQDLARSQGALE